MNYVLFSQWTLERVEDLVGFGIPRNDAMEIMAYVQAAGVNAESASRCDAQFLLEFERVGSEVMAERHGCSGQAIRKKRTKILRRKQPTVARTVALSVVE